METLFKKKEAWTFKGQRGLDVVFYIILYTLTSIVTKLGKQQICHVIFCIVDLDRDISVRLKS